MKSIHERFWSKVEKSNGCWNWLAAKDSRGYGFFSSKKITGKHMDMAHRVVFFLNGTIIPPNLVVDHKCQNKSCVNPKHLRLVTKSINNTENGGPNWVLAHRKHCRNGHLYTKTNTRITTLGRRQCIKCQRKNLSDWKKKHPNYSKEWRKRHPGYFAEWQRNHV